jgi:hypothetical protein
MAVPVGPHARRCEEPWTHDRRGELRQWMVLVIIIITTTTTTTT